MSRQPDAKISLDKVIATALAVLHTDRVLNEPAVRETPVYVALVTEASRLSVTSVHALEEF